MAIFLCKLSQEEILICHINEKNLEDEFETLEESSKVSNETYMLFIM